MMSASEDFPVSLVVGDKKLSPETVRRAQEACWTPEFLEQGSMASMKRRKRTIKKWRMLMVLDLLNGTSHAPDQPYSPIPNELADQHRTLALQDAERLRKGTDR